MTISRKGDELIIKVPENVDPALLQRLIDYINYSQLTLNSKAKQNEVDKIATKVNLDWWTQNKDKFLNE